MGEASSSPGLEVVSQVSAYLARPVGRCLLGPTYAVWWYGPLLNGIIFWDRPDESHVRQVCQALDGELEPGVTPHASLVDARRVGAVDLGAFNLLSAYVRSRRDAFARCVTRQALLRPGGLAGAAVAGFYAVLAPAYPVNVFTEPLSALAWLAVEGGARIAKDLDAVYELATDSPSLVVALRAHLDARLGASSLEAAARALNLSTRQLQRRLLDADTSFQQEERAARIRASKLLLLETNYDVKRVALELGFASHQHFGTFFRRATTETPGQWRARQRK